jgi:hypothetical protein
LRLLLLGFKTSVLGFCFRLLLLGFASSQGFCFWASLRL